MRAVSAWFCKLSLAIAVGAMGISAAHAAQSNTLNETRNRAFKALQLLDERLQNVGWRLIRGNADFCEKKVAAIGLQLIDLSSFNAPANLRNWLGFKGDFAVQAAAQNSPAGRLSAMQAHREITAIGSSKLSDWKVDAARPWARAVRAHDWIDLNLALTGKVNIELKGRQGKARAPVTIEPEEVCASRFELRTGSKRALADGKRVLIGSEFEPITWQDESIFAAGLAHELAHNLLEHRSWLDESGRSNKMVRATEREADRLMPWLLVNAGYKAEAAARFMRRWGKAKDQGIFRNRTHEGWDERLGYILAEIDIIKSMLPVDQKFDWSQNFRREIDPKQAGALLVKDAPTEGSNEASKRLKTVSH